MTLTNPITIHLLDCFPWLICSLQILTLLPNLPSLLLDLINIFLNITIFPLFSLNLIPCFLHNFAIIPLLITYFHLHFLNRDYQLLHLLLSFLLFIIFAMIGCTLWFYFVIDRINANIVGIVILIFFMLGLKLRLRLDLKLRYSSIYVYIWHCLSQLVFV